MGQAITASIERQPELRSAGMWRRGDDIDAIVEAADVIIDFSLPAATDEVLAAVLRHRKPLVCGVSGLNTAQLAGLEKAAKRVPVVYDRNMSLGVAVLDRLVREAASTLGRDFSVEISEVHHVHKKDAPSGTALKLGEAILAAWGEEDTGAVQYKVERRGDVPGDHEVVMQSVSERLSIAHSVTTRQVFADGALRAARWLVGQPPGLYQMRHVLFGE